jgi:transcriptional regulator with XRE-family HTH domain
MQGKSICGRTTPQQCAFGSAVREVRARRGLSQEDLGFEAGLHRNYVGAVERGEINATFRTLLRLTVGLRVSLSDLIVIYERQLGERT